MGAIITPVRRRPRVGFRIRLHSAQEAAPWRERIARYQGEVMEELRKNPENHPDPSIKKAGERPQSLTNAAVTRSHRLCDASAKFPSSQLKQINSRQQQPITREH